MKNNLIIIEKEKLITILEKFIETEDTNIKDYLIESFIELLEERKEERFVL